jgi:hypothetical protein
MLVCMSTKDQTFSSMLHGEALLRAKRTELDPLIAELRELTDGRDDIRVACAGTIAGAWFANPGMARGHELIAAGLLLLAGPPNTDLLLRSISSGFARRAGERPFEPVP